MSQENISNMESKNTSNILKKSLISYIKYRQFKKAVIATKEITNFLSEAIDNRNINLFDVERTIEIQYENFCEIIQDKELIKTMTNFLKRYYDYYDLDKNIAFKMTSKKLLFMWLLIGFPQFTISKTHQELSSQKENIYPNEIYHIAVKLLKSLSDFNSSSSYLKSNNELLRKFTKALNQYSNAITCFLEIDKKEIIGNLAKEYSDTNEILIKEIDKKEMIVNLANEYSDDKTKNDLEFKEKQEFALKNRKKKLLSYINKFDKSITKEELELYSNINLLTNINIEKAQFQIMLNDIKTKDLVYFKKAVENIKTSMLNLKAFKTKNGQDINKVLDSDYIIKKIVTDIFDNNDVAEYGNYLMKILAELQSAESLKESTIKWNSMKEEHINSPMYVFLTNMVFFVMVEIHEIYEQLKLIATISNVGLNPFSI